MTSASNSAVNRAPASAQGTTICPTPWVAQWTRGTWALMMVRSWQVSRCRQRRIRVSYPAAAAPQAGQRKASHSAATSPSTSPASRRKLTAVTRQGSWIPKILA
jgi:hypothetical protein